MDLPFSGESGHGAARAGTEAPLVGPVARSQSACKNEANYCRDVPGNAPAASCGVPVWSRGCAVEVLGVRRRLRVPAIEKLIIAGTGPVKKYRNTPAAGFGVPAWSRDRAVEVLGGRQWHRVPVKRSVLLLGRGQ